MCSTRLPQYFLRFAMTLTMVVTMKTAVSTSSYPKSIRSKTGKILSSKLSEISGLYRARREIPLAFVATPRSSGNGIHRHLTGSQNINELNKIPRAVPKYEFGRASFSSSRQHSERNDSSSEVRQKFMSSVENSSFQPGDVVKIELNGEEVNGTVTERKGGWYTVQISPRNEYHSDGQIKDKEDIIIKKRAKQMKIMEPLNQTHLDSPKSIVETNGEYNSKSFSTVADTNGSIMSPCPPTIVDLDQMLLHFNIGNDPILNKKDQVYLQQWSHFKSLTKWVVFSDLHVSPSSLETCLLILSTVHDTAKSRGAGVLFLGDFWHHRGTVRVDCLNAILDALKDWEVPMIMIPGNHDQVTLGGLEHALKPLQNSYFLTCTNTSSVNADGKMNAQGEIIPVQQVQIPGILIFSHPTKFHNSLFVPHVRDIAIMQAILRSKSAQSLSAVFVHADITGAFMNDLIISTGGISPSYFPPEIPVYSGHFHKPHVVTYQSKNKEGNSEVCIRYVGSPYETSLAEAGQSKALLILDANKGWVCTEEIPLRIGRKHWRIKSIDGFLDLPVSKAIRQPTNEGENNIYHRTTEADTDACDGVVAGDRVVVSVAQEELEEMRRKSGLKTSKDNGREEMTSFDLQLSEFDRKVKDLRSLGASVEIRELKSLSNGPMMNLAAGIEKHLSNVGDESESQGLAIEDMTPHATLSSFLYHEVQREAIKNSTATELLHTGNSLIEEMEGITQDSSISTSGNVGQSVTSKFSTELKLESITIQGFGSFKEVATYPLLDRGLVLLRGSNRDGGSDSNGSGKTTLAMSALWALTGSTDARPVQDAKVSDIVNDLSKSAKVSLRGTINNKAFVISRSKTSSRGSLTFHLDGQDITRQSVKETQMLIDEKLGAGPQILSRTIFHGQHTINGLLEATDSKLKEELSLIVPLTLWQDAAGVARSKSRALSKKRAELNGMISIRKDDIKSVTLRCHSAEETLSKKSKELETKKDDAKRKLIELKKSLTELPSFENNFQTVEHQLKEISGQLRELESHIESKISERDNQLSQLRKNLDDKTSAAYACRSELESMEREFDLSSNTLFSAAEKLEYIKSKWGVNDEASDYPKSFISPATCPTCKQPVNNENSHENLRIEFEGEMRDSIDSIEMARRNKNIIEGNLPAQKNKLKMLEEEMSRLLSNVQKSEGIWNQELSQMKMKLHDVREIHAQKTIELSSATHQLQSLNRISSLELTLQTEIERYQDSLDNSQLSYDAILDELEGIKKSVFELEKEEELLRSESVLMSSLADIFGPRGIQIFILQNAVHALQIASQSYLNELSDGSLRLNLSLDDGDRISRNACVLSPEGIWIDRPLSSLSGGQWRRCSLSLSLGFSDLVSRRGRFRSSLLVLDEPLTHLDSAGRASVGKLLRKMLRNTQTGLHDGPAQFLGLGGLATSTILVILQDLAAEELEESFDCMDEVIKSGGHSNVIIDEVRDKFPV